MVNIDIVGGQSKKATSGKGDNPRLTTAINLPTWDDVTNCFDLLLVAIATDINPKLQTAYQNATPNKTDVMRMLIRRGYDIQQAKAKPATVVTK